MYIYIFHQIQRHYIIIKHVLDTRDYHYVGKS